MNSMVSRIPNRDASREPPCSSQYTSVGATSATDVVSATAHKRKRISTSKSLRSAKRKRPESQSSSNLLQHQNRKISLDTVPDELQLMIHGNLLPHQEWIEIIPSQFLVYYHNGCYITRGTGVNSWLYCHSLHKQGHLRPSFRNSLSWERLRLQAAR